MWLDRDLEANSHSSTAKCTLAYWHHPLFTSGPSAGSNGLMRPIWDVLYKYGVDVVVNGHDHLYERYFPQDPTAIRGPAGITEYIVGTGGAPLYEFGPTAAEQRQQVQDVRRALLHAARRRLGLGVRRSRQRSAARLHLQPLPLTTTL